MIKKLPFLFIVACSLASCSTSKHVIKQERSNLVIKPDTDNGVIRPISKQDKGGDGLVLPLREAGIKRKLEMEFHKFKGVPYRYGGTTSKGFDCSGFTQYTYKRAFNISLPRSTKEMLKVGRKVSKRELKIGDLVFFQPSNRYRHVGIFMGDNMFMHVSTSNGVSMSSLKEAYWIKYYIQSRRLF